MSSKLPQAFLSIGDNDCGRTVLLRTPSPNQYVGVWFSYLPNGDLQTSSSDSACDEPCRIVLRQNEADLVRELEEHPEWANCPTLQCTSTDLGAGERATRAVEQPSGDPERFNPLVVSVYFADALAWIALVLALAWLLVKDARRFRLQAAAGAALVLLSFVIRAFSSGRLPMDHGLLDFEQMIDPMGLLSGAVAFQPRLNHLYLPSFGLFSAFWGYLLDLSVTGFFWVTTILGSVTTYFAFRIGRQLTGTFAGALFCGLAVACSPMSIMFSNGYNIVTLAGLLVLVNASVFIDFVRKPTAFSAIAHAASLVVLSHCRGESMALAAFMALLQFIYLVRLHGRGLFLSPMHLLGMIWPFLAAAIMNIPLMFGLADALRSMASLVAGGALTSILISSAVGAGFLLIYLVSRRIVASIQRPLWAKVLFVAPLIVGVGLAAELLCHFGFSSLWPQSFEDPLFPFTQFYAKRGDSALGSTLGVLSEFVSSPALFPIPWVALAIMAWARPKGRNNGAVAAFAWMALAWLSFLGLLVREVTDGLLTLAGARYMIMGLPLLTALVGLGAFHIVQFVPRHSKWRLATHAALLLLVASPAVTHYAVYSDTIRNPQNEFLFAMKVAQHMGPGTLVLIPDQGLSGELGDETGAVSITMFRTSAMYRTIWQLEGDGDRGISSVGDFALRGDVADRRTLVAITGDCFRHVGNYALAPLCQRLLELPDSIVLEDFSFPNRIMTDASFSADFGPHVPIISPQLLGLSNAGAGRLKAMLQQAHAK